MIRSFNSWSRLTEAEASGKDVMIDPSTGKKHKVTYKVQSNNKFIVKIINDLDIIDNTNRLTQDGINSLVSYLNEENPFTMAIGQLTPSFFKNNFIVYTVLKDGEIFGRTKQKIQFSIEKRKDAEGKSIYPAVADNINFIDSAAFAGISTNTSQIVSQLNTMGTQTVLADPTIEPETPVEKIEAGTGTEETKQERGKKFLYTMRTNSKLYLMEFAQDGTIAAKTKDGSDPNGSLSYVELTGKISWMTTLDDTASKESRVGKAVGSPLFTDSEITNEIDKEFFLKIFTDEEFRNKIIDEYEKEYLTSEINPENLKKMLFYKDGNVIFSEPAAAQQNTNSEKAKQLISDLQNTKL